MMLTAIEQTDAALQSQSVKVLILNIGQRYFGAFIDNVQDVIKRSETTAVPLTPSHIVGLLNLRGHIVTEIDVADTLELKDEWGSAESEGYAIVVNSGEEMYSMVFEGIGDVIDIPQSEIEKLPDTVSKKWGSVSRGVYRMEEKLVVLLDFSLLLEDLTPKQDHV